MKVKNKHVLTGVQQIMLGKVSKNESQAASSLARIKNAGYDGIELNSFMIHKTSFLVNILTSAAGMPTGRSGKLDWLKLIKDSGLKVISMHTDLGSLKKDTAAVIREAKLFSTDYVVIVGMYRFDYSDQKALDGLCHDLNKCGRELSSQGIHLLYHNHNCEWRKVSETSVTAYDYIIKNTDPEYVNFEFDSYWPTEAGVNVPAVMKKLGKRMRLWHATDRGTRMEGPAITPILKSDTVELGQGNMDLSLLKDIALDNEIDAVIVETHRNWIHKDPLESIEISGQWLKNNLSEANND